MATMAPFLAALIIEKQMASGASCGPRLVLCDHHTAIRAPGARLAAPFAGHPEVNAVLTFHEILKRLTYAKSCCMITPRDAGNDIQTSSKPLSASIIMDCTQVHTA